MIGFAIRSFVSRKVARAGVALGWAVAGSAFGQLEIRTIPAPGAVPTPAAPTSAPAVSGGRVSFDVYAGSSVPDVEMPVADGERKPLTADAVESGDWDGTYASGLTWQDDTSYRERRGGRGTRVNALSGDAEPAADEQAVATLLRSLGDFDEKAAEAAVQRARWSTSRSAAVVQHEGAVYVADVAAGKARRVLDSVPKRAAAGGAVFPATPRPEERSELDISPGGRFVSFVQHNDLHIVEARGGGTRKLTRGGSETLLNGILDWVYQEEIYGRGNFRGYWWSGDDKYLAFLQLDESQVPVHTLIDPIPYRQTLEQLHYPKAGDPNPSVRLGVAGTGLFGGVDWIDLSTYAGQEILIVQVSWSPDGRIIFSVQDREQRWMDVNDADPRTGKFHTLLRETSPAWVENTRTPHWLADGSFLWLSERDGFRHVYHHNRDGSLQRRLTDGRWSVDGLCGVDRAGGWVYFTGERESTLEKHAYRVRLAGGNVERLTEPGFNHRVTFNPGCTLFFDTSSNIVTPPRVHLRKADGTQARVISGNEKNRMAEHTLGPMRFVRVPTRDGALLNALLILPPDYDRGRKYPVWCPVYAGPNSPTVQNSWGRGTMTDQLMASEGTIVWRCDPRSASDDGALFGWHAYQRLGQTELEDIEDGLKWLIANEAADPARIGIAGHSYGGYMAAYALTHSTMFKCGIAGAPVTDWRNYDTVYTERYMRTPQNNPTGYDISCVWNAAEKMSGRLLIAHGIMDENVHYANTAQFMRELQRHKKMFDLMLFPKDRHGFLEGGKHWRELQRQFIRERL
jgi:dipeptidyl-peptidase 4